EGEEILEQWSTLIFCPIMIPSEAFNVHGISTEVSRRDGLSLKDAVDLFRHRLKIADRVVAHNTSFDMQLMRIAFARLGLDESELFRAPRFCTMRTATPILQLPSPRGRGHKWPTLQEAYKRLVDSAGFESAHSADVDTLACFKVMRALEEKGVQLV
ncbi:hypothetical protein LCGC14_2984380, partial [marine sediment metagenome]